MVWEPARYLGQAVTVTSGLPRDEGMLRRRDVVMKGFCGAGHRITHVGGIRGVRGQQQAEKDSMGPESGQNSGLTAALKSGFSAPIQSC